VHRIRAAIYETRTHNTTVRRRLFPPRSTGRSRRETTRSSPGWERVFLQNFRLVDGSEQPIVSALRRVSGGRQ
jgi:hypothetical protein